MLGRLATIITPHGGIGFSPQLNAVMQRLIQRHVASAANNGARAAHVVKPQRRPAASCVGVRVGLYSSTPASQLLNLRTQQSRLTQQVASHLLQSPVGIHTGLRRTCHASVYKRHGMDAVYRVGRRSFANFVVVQAFRGAGVAAPANRVGLWSTVKGTMLQANGTTCYKQNIKKKEGVQPYKQVTKKAEPVAESVMVYRTLIHAPAITMPVVLETPEPEVEAAAAVSTDEESWLDKVDMDDMPSTPTAPTVQSVDQLDPEDADTTTMWTLVVRMPTLPLSSAGKQIMTTDAILPMLEEFERAKHQMDVIIKLFRDGVLDGFGIQLRQQDDQLVLSCDRWIGAAGRLLLRRWLSKLGIDATAVHIVEAEPTASVCMEPASLSDSVILTEPEPAVPKPEDLGESSVVARWRRVTESCILDEQKQPIKQFIRQLDEFAMNPPAFARKPTHP